MNESLRLLDALVRTRVVDRDLTSPPGEPVDGSVYIPASGADGVWTDWDFNLAYYVDGAWRKIVPKVGWLVYVIDEDAYLKYEGDPTYWVAFSAGGGEGDPGLVPLAAVTVSEAVASVDLETGVGATYDKYIIDFDAQPATDGVILQARMKVGGSYLDTDEYSFERQYMGNAGGTQGFVGGAAVAAFGLFGGCGNQANEFIGGTLEMLGANRSDFKRGLFRNGGLNTAPQLFYQQGTLLLRSAGAVQGFRFFFSAGNIAAGSTFTLYGARKPS